MFSSIYRSSLRVYTKILQTSNPVEVFVALQCRNHHHNLGETAPIEQFVKSPLRNVIASSNKKILTLEFDDKRKLEYPSVWLRDNCRCNACYDHNAMSRLIDQQEFRPEGTPVETKVESNALKVKWDDGHTSEYEKEWLCSHSFAPSHQISRERRFHEPRLPWDAKKFKQVFQRFPFDKVLNDDETFLRWLVALARHGAALVTDAPHHDKTVQRLCERIAFIRNTLYGEIFYVKSQENAKNTAYKKGKLQMHSDMPFYYHLPGTIFLHCMVQSKDGGDNLLTDGIHCANQLTKEQYRVLADTVVNWSDIGSDGKFQFHSLNREPVLCEDKLGNVKKINWSQPQRDTRFDVSISTAIEWYNAMKQYTTILHDPENAVFLKTQPGDILTFDNRRVIHSRANYSDGARQLNGAYMDWDEIYPKIRMLRKTLNVYDD